MTTDILKRCGIALLAGTLFVASAARADGIDMLAQYTGTKNDTLKLATYTEGDEVVGLVNMVTPGNMKISVAFNKSELAQFVALMQQASQVQSDRWKVIGTYTETQTKSPSHVIVYGGPGVQISLTDPSIGAWSLTLQADDVQGVLAVLGQMGEKVTDSK